uniref:Uncharacterized protein n=1 Tax=Arundo donax TaxID=35708 RepID=A0A0A8YAK4_ARUDO
MIIFRLILIRYDHISFNSDQISWIQTSYNRLSTLCQAFLFYIFFNSYISTFIPRLSYFTFFSSVITVTNQAIHIRLH